MKIAKSVFGAILYTVGVIIFGSVNIWLGVAAVAIVVGSDLLDGREW